MRWVGLSILLFVAAGCSRPTPQPVRHLHEPQPVDTVLLAQMRWNQQMADAADKECIRYVQNQTGRFAQDEHGFWYHTSTPTTTDTIGMGTKVEMRIRIWELNDSLLLDAQQEMIYGADNLPIALQQGLHHAHPGDTLLLIAPWYTAFGVNGNEWVKPYTNIKIELNLQ